MGSRTTSVCWSGVQTGMKNRFVGTNSSREAFTGCCYGQHAEMKAKSNMLNSMSKIDKSKYKRYKYDLISIRVAKDGTVKNSKPCEKCLEHLADLKIHNVYYSTSSDTIVMERFSLMFENKSSFKSSRFINHTEYKNKTSRVKN